MMKDLTSNKDKLSFLDYSRNGLNTASRKLLNIKGSETGTFQRKTKGLWDERSTYMTTTNTSDDNTVEKKLQVMKYNLLVCPSERPGNKPDLNKVLKSSMISEELKSKFNDIYTQATSRLNIYDRNNLCNMQTYKKDEAFIRQKEKIIQKKNEILHLLDKNTTNQKTSGLVTKRNEGRVATNRRSSSLEMKLFSNFNNDTITNESSNRIQKMKNKLEKIIDGEFMIGPLVENTYDFSKDSSIKFQSSNNSNSRRLNDFNLIDLLDKKDSSSSDIRKIVDVDLLSYYNSEERSILKSPAINLLDLDSPNFSLKNQKATISYSKKSRGFDVPDIPKAPPSQIDHKRTKSMGAEYLPFKKVVLENTSSKSQNNSINEL